MVFDETHFALLWYAWDLGREGLIAFGVLLGAISWKLEVLHTLLRYPSPPPSDSPNCQLAKIRKFAEKLTFFYIFHSFSRCFTNFNAF